MKTILAVVLSIVSLPSLAAVEVSAPLVQFPGTKVPMTLVCLNNNGDLQTTFAVQQYENDYRRGGDRGVVRIPVGKKILTTSITAERTVCTEFSRGRNNDRCANYETETFSYPLTFIAEYYSVTHGRERSVKKLIKKEVLNVQDCQ